MNILKKLVLAILYLYPIRILGPLEGQLKLINHQVKYFFHQAVLLTRDRIVKIPSIKSSITQKSL